LATLREETEAAEKKHAEALEAAIAANDERVQQVEEEWKLKLDTAKGGLQKAKSMFFVFALLFVDVCIFTVFGFY
jgi:hypothetical protein